MKNKEIGSEFYDIPLQKDDNLFFHNDTKWFISGRAALDFVIKDIKSKIGNFSVSLPSYCCDSMIAPFVSNEIKIEFYSVIVRDNKIVADKDDIKTEVMLNMNYFGFNVKETLNYKGIVINDITHSMFCETKEYDYTIGSLRKWAAFKTGGFACCKKGFSIGDLQNENIEYVNLRERAILLKKEYIEGKIESKEFLNVFRQAEEKLDNLYEFLGDSEDIELAKKLDIEYIKIKRKENAKVLISNLKEFSLFKEVNNNDCPLFVPIIVPCRKRNDLKSFLIQNGVYCPNHWPISELHSLNSKEKFIYDNELSIVCDQRYNTSDMGKICKLVKEFLK